MALIAGRRTVETGVQRRFTALTYP